MRLYLDEDCAQQFLVRVLRNAGHDVQTPGDVGLVKAKDPVQLRHAVRESRVFLTRNYGDFENLHLLVREAQGHHPGILVIRRDDSTKKNLSPHDVVRALRNLEAAAVALRDEYLILNARQ